MNNFGGSEQNGFFDFGNGQPDNNNGRPNPFASNPNDMIQPRGQRNNNNVDNLFSNNSSQIQQSMYPDDDIQKGTGFSWDDSPAVNGSSKKQSVFTCPCGKKIDKQTDVEKHSFECIKMQSDGYSQFVQVITGITQAQSKKSYDQMSSSEKLKIQNLKSIFELCVPQLHGQAPSNPPPVMAQEEEKMGDIEMIDSSSHMNQKGQAAGRFQPPYQAEPEKKIKEMNMEDFMEPGERLRAQTYYKQVQQEREERLCKFCEKQINQREMESNNMTMIQSTDCFHQVHVDCLREKIIALKSESKDVVCPKCQQPIQDFELNQYLDQEQKNAIDKNQQMQIVKINPDMVSCACGNIMMMEPGDVIKGQKDDKGNPISAEAAKHMANHRIRCNGCEKNFCTKCNTEPYHTGKTCDQNNAAFCRFCQEQLTQASPSMKPAFRDVCRKGECFNMMQQSCDKTLACGHPCCGTSGEKKCMPCLEPECIAKMDPAIAPKENKEDFCNICYCSSLSQEPCVHLECGHIYHIGCVKNQVEKQYNGPRIIFNYLNCPQCKARMSAPNNPQFQALIKKDEDFEKVVIKKALERAKFEDLHKNERLKKPGDRFFNDLQGFALYKLSYYSCFKCSDPYFGGMKDCEAAQNDYQNFKKEELVCGKCSAVSVGGGIKNCKKHGTEYIEFKCKFCCSVAQWFCWGNTHFCEPCHKKQCSGDYVSRKAKDQLPKCPGPSKCPLKIKHPANGEEYAIGCSICKNSVENAKNF